MIHVERATAADRQQVVETVVAAFDQDPAFRFFFRDPVTRDAEAAEFAGHLFDQRVAPGTTWVIEGGRSLAMWDAPRGWSSSEGEPKLAVSDEALARLDDYHRAVQGFFPRRQPFWYLGVLATHPSHAGRRLGREVMKPGLAAAAAAGLPAYLETTNPHNVGVYERAGWRVSGSTHLDDLPIWVLTQ
ncbi:GNAT family N-acetyltransferase [Asanoa sp. WMMD1127]|uniref:GNAT family N-acetyltransferase n=1 Tax=Asanoa sp. WMMD1127 TaxID=3016107 RepID=UPI0024175857|nr:GNAT family N-acetyltransferase [Asanoa sp. WMMD1127]MDG4822001.1 GNAT family N-acetyltransferase [Asanoa sp. WMMD1127]